MKSRKRMLRELEEDIRDHLERETQDNIDRGMSPDEACHAALRKFGNVARIREETWEVWSLVWLEQLWQDVRFGTRMLWRSLGNTIASVLAIALGIGINVGIFSVLNGAALRLLPVPRPEQVVSVSPIFHGHLRATYTVKAACSPTPSTSTTAITITFSRDWWHTSPLSMRLLPAVMYSSFREPWRVATISKFWMRTRLLGEASLIPIVPRPVKTQS
jgi:hypothetical protein